MSASENVWPARPNQGVAVYVDFMNLFLSQDQMFVGPMARSMRVAINLVGRLAETLGDWPSISVYLETAKFEARHPQEWLDLAETCRYHRIHIVNVMPIDGRDAVDAKIMFDMVALSERMRHDPSLRFLLITADGDFIPAVQDVWKRHPVYVGLPTNTRLPQIGWEATAWRWVDPQAWRHMALYDALHPTDRPSEGYLDRALRGWGTYAQTWRAAHRIANILPEVRARGSLLSFQGEIIARLGDSMRDIPARGWSYYVDGLFHYGVLGQDATTGAICVRQDHRALGAPLLAAAK